ncbi:AAA family ATPase [Providencia alcalifaciens]|uniref:AAA family ATPase n=1 Tax=Providencia alcalifaciens TaxID=126385 RepID=UPI0018A7CB69|nr:AAA family ATPase [Providencia alcalifaciens]
MWITYSVGRSARDNRPQLAQAASFDEYKLAIKALKKTINVSPNDSTEAMREKKARLNYIWGALINKTKGRSAANAGNRHVLWLDMDGCSLDAWNTLKGVLSMYRCFCYTTASHEHPTANNEQRWRIGIELDSSVTAQMYAELGPRVEQEIMDCYELLGDEPIKWDRSVYEPSHMVFAPHEGAQFLEFDGAVINVGTVLASDLVLHSNVADISDFDVASDDDLSRLVDLDNIDSHTFDDIRSALWHPQVLNDAKPAMGKHNAWAAMGCRLAWFIDTDYESQARDLWLEWSAAGGGSSDDVSEAARRWDEGKLKADRTGFQSIFSYAQKLGWVNPGTERLKSENSVDLPVSSPYLGGYGEPGRFIIEGLVPVGVTSIYGASATYKSYTALSMALRVALKTHRWAGRNIKGGAVLYIAAEGGNSITPRTGAWSEKHNNGQQIKNFYTLPRAVDLAEPKMVNALLKEIKRIEHVTGEPMRMVVIDTLSQSMTSGDENSAGDMAKFIAGATRIASELSAAVIFIHHAGKDGSKGMRGSSAAFANVDAVIKVERIGESVNLINEKQRTGPTQPTKSYNVPAVPLPEYVIELNERLDNDYTSTDGETYEPVRLTTERVFEDVPMAEIITAFDDESKSTKRDTHESWVWEQLDNAGGRIERAELRTKWKEELSLELNILRSVISRMKRAQNIIETETGTICDASLVFENGKNCQEDEQVKNCKNGEVIKNV